MTQVFIFFVLDKEPMYIARRNAEVIVKYTTAYPFRLPECAMVCVFCSESFDESVHFRTHMKEEHKVFSLRSAFAHIPVEYYVKADCTDLRCRICLKPFETLEQAVGHLKSVHVLGHRLDLQQDLGVQPFMFYKNRMACALCSSKFPNLRSLSRHTQSHFLKYTCETCGKSYSSVTSLRHHATYTHIGDQKICRKCKRTFNTFEERKVHLMQSPRCWQHLCHVCGQRFMTPVLRQKHMVDDHELRSADTYACPECPEVFNDRKKRRHHFVLNHTSAFECPCCDRKFGSQRALDDHKVAHSMEKQFTCPVCLKLFPRKKNLAQHMWIHSAIKRFECKDCNKQFNQRVSWKTHMKCYHPELVEF